MKKKSKSRGASTVKSPKPAAPNSAGDGIPTGSPPEPNNQPSIQEQIPNLSNQGLANLHANAVRIAGDPKNPKRVMAGEALPDIEAEMAGREAVTKEEAAQRKRATAAKRKKKRLTKLDEPEQQAAETTGVSN